MNPDLTLKATINLQRSINHHLRNAIVEIKRIEENKIDRCKINKWPISKSSEKILEICECELAYLDVQYIKLENLKKGIDRNQTQVDLF